MVNSLSVAERSSLLGNSAIISHLRQLNYPEKSISSMLRCGSTELFSSSKQILKFCGCGSKLIPMAHRCNLRTCSYCSRTRKRRIRRNYLNFLRNFKVLLSKKLKMDKREISKYRLRFLTISPQNYDDVFQGISHIQRSFTKFLRREYVSERIKGGIYVIEAKDLNDKGVSNGWNVHIHALVLSRRLDVSLRGKCLDCGQNYIKYDKFSRSYYCANRKCNSLNLIIKENSKLVTEFSSSSGVRCNITISDLSSVSYALNYVLKYISANKDDFSSSFSVAQYIKATAHKPLIKKFGVFVKQIKIKNDNPLWFKSYYPPYICSHCGQIVEYCYDIQVNERLINSSPPPNNFFSF